MHTTDYQILLRPTMTVTDHSSGGFFIENLLGSGISPSVEGSQRISADEPCPTVSGQQLSWKDCKVEFGSEPRVLKKGSA